MANNNQAMGTQATPEYMKSLYKAYLGEDYEPGEGQTWATIAEFHKSHGTSLTQLTDWLKSPEVLATAKKETEARTTTQNQVKTESVKNEVPISMPGMKEPVMPKTSEEVKSKEEKPLTEKEINAIYKKNIGRDATPEEIQHHLTKNTPKEMLENWSLTSPEAQREKTRIESLGIIEGDIGGVDKSQYDYDSWSEELKGLFDGLNNQLQGLIEQGDMIHPDIEITPEEAAAYLSQAKTELSPYYQELASFAEQDLKTNLQQLRENQIASEEQQATKYGRQLTDIGEQAAESGLTFSGRRITGERELFQDYQTNLENQRRQIGYSTQGAVTSAERYLGSERTRDLGLDGATLTGDIMGTLAKSRTVAEQQRASELEETERRKRNLEFYN